MAGSCSKLEEIANNARLEVLKNVYYDNNGFKYSVQHPNATQAVGGYDDPNNNKGKGTGIPFDTNNGGSNVDIFGLSGIGGGRQEIYLQNLYNPNNVYNCF